MASEIEIKLDLQNESDYAKLLEYFGKPDKYIRQTNYFFDTASFALMKSEWTLRVRRANELCFITLKGPREERDDGLAIRKEYEFDLGKPDMDKIISDGLFMADLPKTIQDQLAKLKIDEPFVKFIDFKNDRNSIKTVIENNEYVVELDKTTFADKSIDYELELELQDKDRFTPVMAGLAAILGQLGIEVIPQSEGKFSRALIKSGLDIN